MGIKGLSKFLKDKFPDVYKVKKLHKLRGLRLGVDVTGFFYKYMPVNKDKWFDSFVYMMLSFKENDILPYFVFDGQPPAEKFKVKEKRRQNKISLEEKVTQYKNLVEEYDTKEELTTDLKSRMLSLLGDSTVEDIVDTINNKLKKMESQIINVTEDDIRLFVNISTCFGFPCIVPKYGESEAICSWLCKLKKMDGVISNDTDCMCYENKKVIYDYSPFKKTCAFVRKKKLLKILELTEDQFLDFCIMCGTDYNDNIKGVGPVMSYKFIKEYGSIEEVEKNKHKNKKLQDADFSILNYKRVREIFRKNPTIVEEDTLTKREKRILKNSTTKENDDLSEDSLEEKKKSSVIIVKDEDDDDEEDKKEVKVEKTKRSENVIDETYEMPYSRKPDIIKLQNILARVNSRVKFETIQRIVFPEDNVIPAEEPKKDITIELGND